MRKLISFSVLFAMLAFTINDVKAQQRFKAGLVLGFNAAQLNGDASAGYKRLGLQGGLRATAMLKDKTDLILEMLYSQRGSFDDNENFFPNGDLDIKLNYVEIPVMLSYKDWFNEDEDYYKVQATGGFTYSRLIEATAIGSEHDGEVENFHKNDYGFTIGADFFFTKHLAIGGRWTRSINLLYNNKKHDRSVDSLIGYYLSFRGMYVF